MIQINKVFLKIISRVTSCIEQLLWATKMQ